MSTDHIKQADSVIANPSMLDQHHAIANALLDIAANQERQAVALERIADRLDSWTHDPEPPPDWMAGDSAEAHARGPELRVRRW